MCDDFTLIAEQAALSRRQFGLIGAGAVMAAGSATSVLATTSDALREAMVSVTTPDGVADAFFVRPAKGKHPGVILWPDIGGLRDAFKEMARRLAGHGFAVLAVNHYYRGGKAPVLESFAQFRTPEGMARLKPLIAQVNPATTASDSKAFVAWLDAQKWVDSKRKIGNYGHCMTGSYTVRAAAAVPGRVGAAASLHGGGLVGPAADSPDKLIAKTTASFLFAIARNDDAKARGDKDALKAAAKAAKRPAEVEVYKADHGWTVLDSPTYDKAEADRAFDRMLALFNTL